MVLISDIGMPEDYGYTLTWHLRIVSYLKCG
jgi:hypothetical protein